MRLGSGRSCGVGRRKGNEVSREVLFYFSISGAEAKQELQRLEDVRDLVCHGRGERETRECLPHHCMIYGEFGAIWRGGAKHVFLHGVRRSGSG